MSASLRRPARTAFSDDLPRLPRAPSARPPTLPPGKVKPRWPPRGVPVCPAPGTPTLTCGYVRRP
jgi:hypothetical protein